MLMDGAGTPCYVVVIWWLNDVVPYHMQIVGTSTVRVLVPRYGAELELQVVAHYEEVDFAYLRHVKGSWRAMHTVIV